MSTRSPKSEDPFSVYEDLDEDDDMFSRRERHYDHSRDRAKVVPEFVRRAIESTVESVQASGSLSKDALGYLLQQGDRGKREVVRIVAKEVGDFLRHVDISTEIIKVLTSISVDFNANVRFKYADGKLKPEIDARPGVSVVGDTHDEIDEDDALPSSGEEPEEAQGPPVEDDEEQ